MTCKCGEHIDEHAWRERNNDEGALSVVVHSDPELVDFLDTFRLWMRDIQKECDKQGYHATLGDKGLLFSTFWTVKWTDKEGFDIVDVSFALLADGSWLPSPANVDNLFACCGYLRSACHPLSSTKGSEFALEYEESGLEALSVTDLFNFVVKRGDDGEQVVDANGSGWCY